MKKLQELLDRELSKPEQDRDNLYVNTLLKSIDNNGMTFEMFSNTGRFVPRHSFTNDSPNTLLNSNCIDVVKYIGNFFVQKLKGGWYFFESDDERVRRKNMEVIEKYIWDKYANNYLNVDK